jgi:hypothetical protein
LVAAIRSFTHRICLLLTLLEPLMHLVDINLETISKHILEKQGLWYRIFIQSGPKKHAHFEQVFQGAIAALNIEFLAYFTNVALVHLLKSNIANQFLYNLDW